MLIEILRSTAIVAGVGLVFGILITIAHMKLKVWEDPRIDAIADMLPGSNCGACGQAGCRAFAEALIAGKVAPAQCTVMGPEDVEDVANMLGVDAGESQKKEWDDLILFNARPFWITPSDNEKQYY